MVKIPLEIKEFVEEQGVFVVGSTGGSNLTNVSPRLFFKINDEAIYWLDFFKHKSYKNLELLVLSLMSLQRLKLKIQSLKKHLKETCQIK